MAGILEITETDGVNDGQAVFGPVPVDQVHQNGIWQITNQGNASVNITLAFLEGTSFQCAGSGSIIIAPGMSHSVEVLFDPVAPHAITDTITLRADDLDSTTLSVNLTGDAYAWVTAGNPYKFADHTGDLVTISVTGSAQVHVTTGTEDQPDIQTIEVVAGSSTDKLNIKVRGSGTTYLGEIIGANSLGAINAKNVDLIGAGIDLEGTLQKLSLGSVLGGADISFAADRPVDVNVNQIIGDSDINIAGPVGSFAAHHFLHGSFQADSVTKMHINGHLNADVQVNGNLDELVVCQGNLNGNLNVNGVMGKVSVREGDILGSINAADDIHQIVVQKGTIGGTVKSGAVINKIIAQNISGAGLYARTAIEQINVQYDMRHSLVTVGYDDQAAHNQSAAALSEIDAYISSLKVKGIFRDSTIAVGVAPDDQGNFINGRAHTKSGTIENLFLRQVDTNNGTDPFGVVAQDKIGTLRVNEQVLGYNYHQDDFFITVIDQ